MFGQWIKTADQLPTRELLKSEFGKGVVSATHADCYIFIFGLVTDKPYNFDDKCWDDEEYEGHEFDALEPTHWMLAPRYPAPPV